MKRLAMLLVVLMMAGAVSVWADDVKSPSNPPSVKENASQPAESKEVLTLQAENLRLRIRNLELQFQSLPQYQELVKQLAAVEGKVKAMETKKPASGGKK